MQNTVAIVTGASRGIGKAIARSLAAEGSHVFLASRSQSDLDALAREFQSAGFAATPLATDVTKQEEVDALVQSAMDAVGHIDILVNNAGVGIFKPLMDMTPEEFDEMWMLNMRGVFLMTKAVLPHMVQAKAGNIVNISSLAGKNTFKGGSGYCATKWALRGFGGSLMLEVRDSNIRVVTVFPGSVDTSFSTRGKRGQNITQPEDVADAVVFALTAPQRSMFSEIDVRPTRPA